MSVISVSPPPLPRIPELTLDIGFPSSADDGCSRFQRPVPSPLTALHPLQLQREAPAPSFSLAPSCSYKGGGTGMCSRADPNSNSPNSLFSFTFLPFLPFFSPTIPLFVPSITVPCAINKCTSIQHRGSSSHCLQDPRIEQCSPSTSTNTQHLVSSLGHSIIKLVHYSIYVPGFVFNIPLAHQRCFSSEPKYTPGVFSVSL